MTTLIFFALFFFAGVTVGALAYRKNAERAKAIEAKAKTIAEAFKK